MNALLAAPGVSTLFEAFQTAAQQSPAAEAIVSGDIRIAYGELAALVDRCAELLEQSGVRHGDRVGILRNGFLSIVGREKEQIRSGGYNISPTDVENVLATHPGVAFGVVLGVSDPEYGEAARERLAGYKVPKRFWQWSELPLLANGKKDRRELRRRILSESTEPRA